MATTTTDLQVPREASGSGGMRRDGGGSFSKEWIGFFLGVARKLKGGGDVALVTTADATDLASAQALANQLKITVNALLAGLKT